ncbi:hypothetical protein [Myxococcus sp. AS-1-15]|uniref:hypothetical protein n=1 Tax=Myxococcus sp. AS-1-15 TaxID=2874600 RepID=UPI001CBBCC5D|nr:hypothetical protein [Myxococcus sp. AS-1-15]MBZ4402022.1 hypothetical protein [Myxococcus sp. AS-1-15]
MSDGHRFRPGTKAHTAALALMDAWGWAEPQPGSGKPQGRLDWDGEQWHFYDEPAGADSERRATAHCPIQAVIEGEMAHQEGLRLVRGDRRRLLLLEPGLRWTLGDPL